MLDAAIPREWQDHVEAELEPNERVEWIDMPVPRFITLASTAVFLFAIPWTAFAIFWMWGASGFGATDIPQGFRWFPLFGLPFVLVGIGMLLSPIWMYRKAFKTVYVITDRRAITIESGFHTTIRSYLPNNLREIYRRERRDGTGDVIISRLTRYDSEGCRSWQELGFQSIRNPREVEQMLRDLAAKDIAQG